MRNDEKKHSVTDSFNVAIEGIIDAIRTERNMKFHLFCGVVILFLCIFLELTKYELISVSFSITLVVLAELLNTAIETTVDMICKSYHPLAKKAKDVAAGAVLVSAINAAVVGYIIFQRRIMSEMGEGFTILKNSYQHSMVLIIAILLILVIAIKTYFKKGTPLKGGIPSGHSALAGALFTGIFYLTDNPKIFFLSFLLLILVLQSRVEGRIHTVIETVIGATLGVCVTYVLLAIIGV
ncbi:MAG: diacylglycerol kinase [Cetobacterium sp.]|uniref:diacylglycerol kinase n=1 Tax=unclassified Cetobacterium TaxID=2630983 RepID=UPI00163B7BE4|nr:diacylglycerol kinase [Cetobacterium sp. 2A]MBC2855806.1 diacylglycerol kinase [Cetobacterium sp. 2A]